MGLMFLRKQQQRRRGGGGFVKEIYEKGNKRWKVRGTENESMSPSMERNAIHLSRSLTNSSPYGSHKSNLNKPVVI